MAWNDQPLQVPQYGPRPDTGTPQAPAPQQPAVPYGTGTAFGRESQQPGGQAFGQIGQAAGPAVALPADGAIQAPAQPGTAVPMPPMPGTPRPANPLIPQPAPSAGPGGAPANASAGAGGATTGYPGALPGQPVGAPGGVPVPSAPRPPLTVAGTVAGSSAPSALSAPLPANAQDSDQPDAGDDIWIERAKRAIAETQNDPYRQLQLIQHLGVLYLKERFGREVQAEKG